MRPDLYRTLFGYLDISDEEMGRFFEYPPGTSKRYGATGGDGPPESVAAIVQTIMSSGATGDDMREALRRLAATEGV